MCHFGHWAFHLASKQRRLARKSHRCLRLLTPLRHRKYVQAPAVGDEASQSPARAQRYLDGECAKEIRYQPPSSDRNSRSTKNTMVPTIAPSTQPMPPPYHRFGRQCWVLGQLGLISYFGWPFLRSSLRRFFFFFCAAVALKTGHRLVCTTVQLKLAESNRR